MKIKINGYTVGAVVVNLGCVLAVVVGFSDGEPILRDYVDGKARGGKWVGALDKTRLATAAEIAAGARAVAEGLAMGAAR